MMNSSLKEKSLPVTVTVITLNEERNLARCLKSVRWASEVIVVDSGSIDRTQSIAESMGVKFVVHEWKGYGQQKNFAQSLSKNSWVLNLDADETCSLELANEISQKLDNPEFSGFEIPRKTFYLGKWILHGGWYPNYLVRLARKNQSQWTEPNIHEAWKVEGKVGRLRGEIYHYSFEGIVDQVEANLKYAQLGARELQRKKQRPSWIKMIFKPVGKFLETYVWKRGFLDGWPGFLISMNAAYSMFLRYALHCEYERISHRQ